MTKNQTVWAEQAAQALANLRPLRPSRAFIEAGDRYDAGDKYEADIATWLLFVEARIRGERPTPPPAASDFDEAPFEDELALARDRQFDPPTFDDVRYRSRVEGADDSGYHRTD